MSVEMEVNHLRFLMTSSFLLIKDSLLFSMFAWSRISHFVTMIG